MYSNFTYNYLDAKSTPTSPISGMPYNIMGAAPTTVFGTPADSFTEYYLSKDYNNAAELAMNSNRFGGRLLDVDPLNLGMMSTATSSFFLGRAAFFQRSLFSKLWDLDPVVGTYLDYQAFSDKGVTQ